MERLQSLDNTKLIDAVKNYRQYGYDTALRNEAIQILKERGIDEEDLKLTGNFDNNQYDAAKDILAAHSRYSKKAFASYVLLVVSNVSAQIIGTSSETEALLFFGMSILVLVLFLLFIGKAMLSYYSFYKTLDKDPETSDMLIYFFLGLPFYFGMYFYYRNRMREEMMLIQ